MGGNVGGLSRLPAAAELFVCMDMFVGPSDVIHTVGLPRSISVDDDDELAAPGSLLVLSTLARDLGSRNGDAILRTDYIRR